MPRIDPEKLEAARRLYLKYRGRHHRVIESEMHALGFATFTRRVFYTGTRNNRLTPGWPARFNWKAELLQHDEPDLEIPRSALRDPQSPDPFQAWLKIVSPGMTWDWRHQVYLYDKLRAITEGRIRRLMIFMPPRHGKSELVTVRYAAWRLHTDPSLNLILGSYNQRLANRFSRKIRSVWEDAMFLDHKAETNQPPSDARETLGSRDGSPNATANNHDRQPSDPQLPRSSRTRLNTAAEWETFGGGGVRAVGVGAGITGFGAKLVIIDDPVKSRAEAESPTYRTRLWEWFNDDIYTRLEPDAAVILIQTRWHHDDLAGRLLAEMAEEGGEQWEIVNLPALAIDTNGSPPYARSEVDAAFSAADGVVLSSPQSAIPNQQFPDPLNRRPGEALCPERYDEIALDRIRRKLGSYSFSALYQQSPVPLDGGLFNRAWFTRIVDRAPENLRWCRGYDLAVSTKTSADYTASFRCALDKATGILYIADGFRRRIEFPEQRRYIVDRIRTERRTEHGIELALHGQALLQELRREELLLKRTFRGVKVDTDKVSRSLAWSARAEEGKVALVRGPWIQDFLDEISQFPNGPHDDQVDAVSLAVQMLSSRSRTGYGF